MNLFFSLLSFKKENLCINFDYFYYGFGILSNVKGTCKKEGKRQKICMSTTGFEPPTSLGLYWQFSFLAFGQKPLRVRTKL